jgi:hypothetical protein
MEPAMRQPIPLFERLNSRANEIERAVTAALTCAGTREESCQALVPDHLVRLQALVRCLTADVRCLVALGQAAALPIPEAGAA